jgi:hypothetical protein
MNKPIYVCPGGGREKLGEWVWFSIEALSVRTAHRESTAGLIDDILEIPGRKSW